MDRNIRVKLAEAELAAATSVAIAKLLVEKYPEVTLGELRKKEVEFPTTLGVTEAEAEAIMLAVANIIVGTSNVVRNTGSGAVATNGGIAAGAGGIAIGGNAPDGIRLPGK